MPKVFVRKDWYFDPSNWPIISFHHPKNCQDLINSSSDGDYVAIIAVKDKKVKPEERGRLLGIAKFYREQVDSIKFISKIELHKKDNYHDKGKNKGQFRWPYAVRMIEAWKFSNPPIAEDVIGMLLPYRKAASKAEPLEEKGIKAVLKLLEKQGKKVPVGDKVNNFGDSPAESAGNKKGARAKGRSYGPPPTEYSVEQKRNFKGPAYVYVSRFSDSDIWKIGWAKNVTKRLESLNDHVPYEILKQEWKPYLNKEYDSGKIAHDAEQAMLDLMEAEKFSMWGERVQCSEEDIKKAWKKLKQMF